MLFTPFVLAVIGSTLVSGAVIPQAPTFRAAGTVVEDNYIVVLKPDVSAAEFESHASWTTSLHANRLRRRDDSSLSGINRRYQFSTLTGYSGSFDSATIQTIKDDPLVAYVEPDRIVRAFNVTTQPRVPSWGLARLSSKTGNTYTYDSSAGSGTHSYVIDTGINLEHEDFAGRVEFGFSSTDDGSEADGVGHGTHVAGTIGGTKYGVAKKTNLIAVKVLDDQGSGTNSGVIAGIEWVVTDAQKRGASKSVANMSLGGGKSNALDQAVEAAIEEGVTFVVAAGNENQDAGNTSPASVTSAITVGAIAEGDRRAEYSNYGDVVDVFAPGSEITSAWIGSSDAEETIDGTSMASPHVAGLVAYLIALEGLEGPEEVRQRILELAEDVVTGAPSGTTDALVGNGANANSTVTRKFLRRF
jgi:oryzin